MEGKITQVSFRLFETTRPLRFFFFFFFFGFVFLFFLCVAARRQFSVGRASMQVSDRESAVFALPRATVWDLLLRVDFAQLAAGSSYLSLRPVPVSLRCSSACSNSRSHPASPSFRVVGASSQQGLLQVECTTQLREDGPALTRQEQFRLFPITRTGGTLLEWTTTATVTIAAAAAVSKSVEGLGALLQRSLSKRQLFHLIRDEANPKPAREKLEDLLGVLVGQIKSTPSYLENLASSVDVSAYVPGKPLETKALALVIV